MLNLSTRNTIAKLTLGELVHVKHLGLQEYTPIWQQQKQFTQDRSAHTTDEIWCLEHLPVFTQGQAGKPEHLLYQGAIPLVQSDRGGQITYHGPGQLIVYCLVDIQRKNINIREFVSILEESVLALLSLYKIQGTVDKTAPGVYVDHAKICSIGLRVRHGRTYHGLSLNVAMNTDPFTQINPCGYANMQVTQIQNFIANINVTEVVNQLLPILQAKIGYAGAI